MLTIRLPLRPILRALLIAVMIAVLWRVIAQVFGWPDERIGEETVAVLLAVPSGIWAWHTWPRGDG